MSRIDITITTQEVIDFQDFGAITLGLEIEGVSFDISLELSSFSTQGSFARVVFFAPQSESDSQQANNYIQAFTRDYRNTGGIGNITATQVGVGVVRLESNVGQFTGGAYTGDYLANVDFDAFNLIDPDAMSFFFERTDIGSCDAIDYKTISAAGGTGNYRLNLNGLDFLTDYDGQTEETFSLNRGVLYQGSLIDDNEEEIALVGVNVPRKFVQGDFRINQTDIIGGANVTIETVSLISNTAPYTYQILDKDGNESEINTTGVFTGLLIGTNVARITDRYGCVLDIAFVVTGVNVTNDEGDTIRFFNVSDFNSLAFTEIASDKRPNFYNTAPINDEVGVAYNLPFYFPSTSNIKTQFRSSYDTNRVTLLFPNGTGQDIPVIEIQTNIGTAERVDCKTFPLADTTTLQGGAFVITEGRTAVYFDGGNNYIPNSNVVDEDNPTSPYNSGLPSWAIAGQIVTIDGLGTFEISESGLFDTDRNSLYFIINVITQEESTLIVETLFNRHPYNVFRADFDMSLIPDCAALLIESGFGEEIERSHVTPPITLLNDFSNFVKITWKSLINFDDMLFTDGIDCEMWLEGRLRPFSVSNAEIAENDNSLRTLKNRHRLGQRLYVPFLHPLKWHKLSLASGIGDFGDFRIEDLLLVVTQMPEGDEILDSNLTSVTAEYALGNENLGIVDGEVVLNPSLGQEAIDSAVDTTFNAPCYLRLDDGTWLLDTEGNYIEVDKTIGTVAPPPPFDAPSLLRLDDGTWILNGDGDYIEIN